MTRMSPRSQGSRSTNRIEKKEAQKKLPFTTQQLQEIITHPEFLRNKTEHPNWWWITWIAIYQGLRLAEPAQLLVSQVVKDVDSGVWYFNIEEAPDTTQSVKSASGWRKVPIHQALIDKLGISLITSQRPSERDTLASSISLPTR